jgi:hypothetical protein
MATNAEHRTAAETWLTVAETNYMEVVQSADARDRTDEDLKAQLEGGCCAAAIAQAHATLALGTEAPDA